METFLVFGQDALNKTFSLNLPSAKHFEKIPNTEEHAGNDFDSLKLVFKKQSKDKIILKKEHITYQLGLLCLPMS